MSNKYLRPISESLREIIGVRELRDPGRICEGCYFRVLKAKDDHICPVCGKTQRKKRQWHKDIRKFEPYIKRGRYFFAERCCQECYDNGTYLAKHGRERRRVLQNPDHVCFGAERAGNLIANDDGSKPLSGFSVPTETVVKGLLERVRIGAYLSTKEIDVVESPEALQEKMDAEAGGLYSIFFRVFQPPSGAGKWTQLRTAVLL